jgi:hypothetical protein
MLINVKKLALKHNLIRVDDYNEKMIIEPEKDMSLYLYDRSINSVQILMYGYPPDEGEYRVKIYTLHNHVCYYGDITDLDNFADELTSICNDTSIPK